MKNRRSGFTLVEILVVLGIIALLAALLFPAFNRARENGRQTSCASNLTQIYLAVQQYKADNNYYPDGLIDLLGDGAKYQLTPTTTGTIGYDTAGTAIPDKGTGYFKGGQDQLTCLDDDSITDVPRSSYGYLSKSPVVATLPPAPIPSTFSGDMGQYVWNYFGYRPDGFVYQEDEIKAGVGIGTGCTTTAPCPNLVNPYSDYALYKNPFKFSMGNRFAPPSTVITHCVYHRLITGNNLNTPTDLYAVPGDSLNARDIVLRLDGSYKAVDVSQWNATAPNNLWQKQIQ